MSFSAASARDSDLRMMRIARVEVVVDLGERVEDVEPLEELLPLVLEAPRHDHHAVVEEVAGRGRGA